MAKPVKNHKRAQPARYNLHTTLSASYQPGAGTVAVPQPGAVEGTVSKKKDRNEKRRFGVKRALLILFILMISPFLIIGAWDLKNASRASEKMFGNGNVLAALLPTSLDATPENRVNILMIGNSADDPGHGGALLTDTIMVISLDKKDKSGYMVSVPRDLYVDIPDYGYAKINEAYQAGERQKFQESGYFPGGVGLVQKVVSDSFGMPLHYYVILDYGSVRDIVDALGGVTVNIASSDPRGIYDPNFKPEEGGPLKLTNGQHRIDGKTALRLTRARGATYGSYGFPMSDFNRTQNQQQVFSAIKNELNWKVILDPRLNEKIFNALADNLTTNADINEVLPLFRLFRSVPDDQLRPVPLRNNTGTINLLTGYRTPNGQSALIPSAGIDDYTEIQSYIKRLGN